MANFFKDYQRQVQDRRAREQEQETRKKKLEDYFENLERGEAVQIYPSYDWKNGTGEKYFVMMVKNSIVLSDTREEALSAGSRYIYNMSVAIV